MFNFTALLGSRADSKASQSLLELDGGVKILIDVGWDEYFDVASLQALESHVSTISIVLLTHPTLSHLGAFAHLCKHVPQFKSIPVYATTPVISLGRTLLQDVYASSYLARTVIPSDALAELSLASGSNGQSNLAILLQPPSADEIAGYFSLINPLKYSQPLQPVASPFSPSLNGLTITAYGAGHTLGGTIWHIQHGLESIVYAVDWNQAKENTLSGAAWLGGSGGGAEILEPLKRPTALICSSRGIERAHVAGGRKKRDSDLLSAVDQTLAKGGIVLLPTDSSARILELAYILEQHWRKKVVGGDNPTYETAKVHLASRTAGSTLRFARSMLEWLDDGLVRETEAENEAARGQRGEEKSDQTPFDFKHVKLLEKRTKLQRLLESNRPAVILASDITMDWGFSNDALRTLCTDAKNLVILTERPDGSKDNTDHQAHLSQLLWSLWQSSVGEDVVSTQMVSGDGIKVTAREALIEPLKEADLSIYQQYLARRRQIQSTQQGDDTVTSTNPAEAVVDDQSSTSSEESEGSDNDQQGRALNLTAAINQTKRKAGLTDAELGVNILLRRRNVFDYDVRGKRGREKMYPFAIKRSRDDEYGDAIRPEDYLRAEERDEDAQADTTEVNEAATTGQKRKWADANPSAKDTRKQQKTNGKRQGTANGTGLTSSTRGIGNANGHVDSGSESSDGLTDDEEEEVPSGPQKIVFTQTELSLQLNICHIDFSGLAEKRDLQMLIPLIRPRKIVITAGTESETQDLAEDCRTLLGEDAEGTKIVFTPKTGDQIDVSVDTNAWSIKLTRELVRKLAWQNVKGLGVVAVTARLKVVEVDANDEDGIVEEVKRKKIKTGEGTSSNSEQTSKNDADGSVEPEPVLDILSTSTSATTSQVSQPIHVGDLRLADLRRLMQANGHVAEFRGEGILLIDGTVIVRKTAGGRVEVEGGAYVGPNMRYDPTASFGEVRKRIYEGLAIVAGG